MHAPWWEQAQAGGRGDGPHPAECPDHEQAGQEGQEDGGDTGPEDEQVWVEPVHAPEQGDPEEVVEG